MAKEKGGPKLVLQMLLFGFAINTDPRHLPAAVHLADDSRFARSIGAALVNSTYFDIVAFAKSPEDAERIARSLGGPVVVKAQVHAGGRGKAGGVKLAKDPAEADAQAQGSACCAPGQTVTTRGKPVRIKVGGGCC